MSKYSWIGIVLPLLASLAACELSVTNPNARTEQEVLTTADGILALAVGMQDQFAEEVEAFVQAPALVTDEWGTGTRSLAAYQVLLVGSALSNDLGTVAEPWVDAYRVINSADKLTANAPGVGLEPGRAQGIVALAKLFKAMSLGMLYIHFERAPVNVTAENPVPQPRAVVLDSAIALLESARTDLAGVPAGDLAFLRSRVIANGFDLANTIDAMLARYSLFAGRHQKAIEAAQRVDMSVRSVFPYPPPDRNPIFNLSIELNYVFPLASFVAEAEAGDQRPAYWVDVSARSFTGNPDSLLLPLRQYSERSDPFPVYLPDEMKLIQAEAFTRLGNFARARELINEVRTQTTNPPVAGLPPLPPEALDTEAELLRQIAYERRYELYMQGLRWEDMRRLAAFIPRRPTFMFLPIPRQECVNNPNACGS